MASVVIPLNALICIDGNLEVCKRATDIAHIAVVMHAIQAVTNVIVSVFLHLMIELEEFYHSRTNCRRHHGKLYLCLGEGQANLQSKKNNQVRKIQDKIVSRSKCTWTGDRRPKWLSKNCAVFDLRLYHSPTISGSSL